MAGKIKQKKKNKNNSVGKSSTGDIPEAMLAEDDGKQAAQQHSDQARDNVNNNEQDKGNDNESEKHKVRLYRIAEQIHQKECALRVCKDS